MSARTMVCAYCGDRRAWPDGFVNSIEAYCWPCWWKHHLETDHTPKKRRWRP